MAIRSVGSNVIRDYLDLNAFVADLPATLLEQEVADMYNDSEFVSTVGVVVSGITTTAAFNIVIRAAVGQAFNDTEQALRYNSTNGVGIRKSTAYGTAMTISVNHTVLQGLQIAGTGSNRTVGLSITSGANCTVENCLISSASNGAQYIQAVNTTQLINTAVIVNQGASTSAVGIRISYATAGIHNCTLINLSGNSTNFGIEKVGGAADSSVVKNTAVFGFQTAMESGTWGAGTDFNATDNATLPAGSNNLTSLTDSDEFENVASDATLDLRLKAGNSLDGAGTPDSSFTNDLDIFGNARSTLAPSIGVYETITISGVSIPVIMNQLRNQGIS